MLNCGGIATSGWSALTGYLVHGTELLQCSFSIGIFLVSAVQLTKNMFRPTHHKHIHHLECQTVLLQAMVGQASFLLLQRLAFLLQLQGLREHHELQEQAVVQPVFRDQSNMKTLIYILQPPHHQPADH